MLAYLRTHFLLFFREIYLIFSFCKIVNHFYLHFYCLQFHSVNYYTRADIVIHCVECSEEVIPPCHHNPLMKTQCIVRTGWLVTGLVWQRRYPFIIEGRSCSSTPVASSLYPTINCFSRGPSYSPEYEQNDTTRVDSSKYHRKHSFQHVPCHKYIKFNDFY